MRTKCSGEKQPCEKCIKDEAQCVLNDRRHERHKKSTHPEEQFKALTGHRDLITTKQRVAELESKKDQLLQALKGVAQSPALSDDERAILIELTSHVFRSIAQSETGR
jgi:hypothetical protein